MLQPLSLLVGMPLCAMEDSTQTQSCGQFDLADSIAKALATESAAPQGVACSWLHLSCMSPRSRVIQAAQRGQQESQCLARACGSLQQAVLAGLELGQIGLLNICIQQCQTQ